ncbi:MAG: tetratricopeptide repeat protein, partial [Myxococcales bacterium]
KTGKAPTGATTHTQTRNAATNTTHMPRAQQTQGVATPGVHLRAKTTTNMPARTATPAPFQTPRPLRKDQDGVRRDPAGRRGISPFWDAIRRGDEAVLVRDLARAEVAYQAAIVIESENPIAYLRLGQISVRGSKLDRAEVAYRDALRLSSRDSTLRATALFVLADLRERQGQRDEAIAAWQSYEEYLKKDPNAKGYPETPIERASRLRKYSALAAESKAVRERINLRIKEADEASRRKTTNNPNANR